ncbi:hypothetical protein KCU62_g9495, partial [Aureobasidium sp. EXF-3399]
MWRHELEERETLTNTHGAWFMADFMSISRKASTFGGPSCKSSEHVVEELALAVAQAATIGQTYVLLPIRSGGLDTAQAIQETFYNSFQKFWRQRTGFGPSSIGDWDFWCRNDTFARLYDAMYIHNAELSIFNNHYGPLRSHPDEVPMTSRDDLYLAQTPRAWQSMSNEQGVSRVDNLARHDTPRSAFSLCATLSTLVTEIAHARANPMEVFSREKMARLQHQLAWQLERSAQLIQEESSKRLARYLQLVANTRIGDIPAMHVPRALWHARLSPLGVVPSLTSAPQLYKESEVASGVGICPEKENDLRKLNDMHEHITALPVDMLDTNSIGALRTEVGQNSGRRLDFLVNNAGIHYASMAIDIDVAKVREVFEVNVVAMMQTCKMFSSQLIAAGGKIVRIGIRQALEPFGFWVIEAATGYVQSDILRHGLQAHARSIYLPIIDHIETLRRRGNLGGTTGSAYVKAVVARVLQQHPPRELWQGNCAWLLLIVTTWISMWLAKLFWYNTFQLRRLRQ